MRDQLADLRISNLRRDGGTQMRAEIDEDTVEEYMACLADLPPVTVFYDGKTYWLASGFHRVAAHERAGKKMVCAEVKSGTQRDAILHAAGDNATHGRRRTNADKRRAVETLLRDAEWSKWSNVKIAERTQVGLTMVASLRRDLDAALSSGSYRTCTRNGKEYTMRVDNIGDGRASTKADMTAAENSLCELAKGAAAVYVIEAGEKVKIGFSHVLASRFQAILSTNPDASLVAIFLNHGVELEKKLHAAFNKKRMAGEWFSVTAQDVCRQMESWGLGDSIKRVTLSPMKTANLSRREFDAMPEANRIVHVQRVEAEANERAAQREAAPPSAPQRSPECPNEVVVMLPDELYLAVGKAAEKARRSLNAEILAALREHYGVNL